MRNPYVGLAVAVGLAAIGLVVFLADSSLGYVGSIGPGSVGYFITTERAVGIGLGWLATLFGARLLGGLLAAKWYFPSATLAANLSGFIALMVGLFLVFVVDAIPTFTIGSFSFDADGVSGRRMPFLLFLTPEREIGLVTVWAATVVLATFMRQGSRRPGIDHRAAH